MEPTVVADTMCHTGENPLWHPHDEDLLWTDIPNGVIYGYNPTAREYERFLQSEPIRGFTIQIDGGLVLFHQNGSITVTADSTSAGQTLVRKDNERPFNDVIADPRGRVFCGVIPTENRPGRLMRLDVDGSLNRIDGQYEFPNGFGFTPDNNHLYFTDSRANRIYKLSYNEEDGSLGSREVFVDTTEEPGRPDGLTVDSEGYVWSARYEGNCVIRYTPDGSIDEKIEFPARRVTSITFGGNRYRTAYVTTALAPSSESIRTRGQEGAGAGALFSLEPQANGVPEFSSEISTPV